VGDSWLHEAVFRQRNELGEKVGYMTQSWIHDARFRQKTEKCPTGPYMKLGVDKTFKYG